MSVIARVLNPCLTCCDGDAMDQEDIVLAGYFGGLSTATLAYALVLTVACVASCYLGIKLNKFKSIRQEQLEFALFNQTIVDPNYLAQLDVQIARYTRWSYINIVNLTVTPIFAGLGAAAVCGGGISCSSLFRNRWIEHYDLGGHIRW